MVDRKQDTYTQQLHTRLLQFEFLAVKEPVSLKLDYGIELEFSGSLSSDTMLRNS